ncbi:hypothetical protein AVEN_226796-1 [Araneus ventricosus]|uniref:Uncharacterized protein n=1 Tax=Araneus ventricosus TaxID=182803 RepID=A0A4Y2LCV4_ARAVE|nr:hypothetical protein AVEN_226796-1 [Araneus ventricosus]
MTSAIAIVLLESEDITRMDCPTYCSDLNPMENIGGFAETPFSMIIAVGQRQQLKQIIVQEYPQLLLDNLVLSMEKRLQAIIKVKGSHIPCLGTSVC